MIGQFGHFRFAERRTEHKPAEQQRLLRVLVDFKTIAVHLHHARP